MKVKNTNIPFAHITVSRKILKSDDGILKKSIADAIVVMNKKAKGCNIYIGYAHKDKLYVGFDHGHKTIIYVQKQKRIPVRKKIFSSTVVGKAKEHIIANNTILCAGKVIEALEKALKSCKKDFRKNLYKKFGNPTERALKYPKNHIKKLEMRKNFQKSLQSNEVVIDYCI